MSQLDGAIATEETLGVSKKSAVQLLDDGLINAISTRTKPSQKKASMASERFVVHQITVAYVP